jgi:hypothetical protein
MIFNGHTAETVNEIDEETFAEITVMYADGVLGNKGIFEALTPITTAVFNFMRDGSTPAFSGDKIFPWIREYNINPDVDAEGANQQLLTFLTSAPGFTMEKFNVGVHQG